MATASVRRTAFFAVTRYPPPEEASVAAKAELDRAIGRARRVNGWDFRFGQLAGRLCDDGFTDVVGPLRTSRVDSEERTC